MTVIPPMAAPSVPAARTAGTGAGPQGGDEVAAVFSALVAAVSAELAASEQASTADADVLAGAGESSDDAALGAGEVDDVAGAAAAAALLGMVASPARSETPEATPDVAGGGATATIAATSGPTSTLAGVDVEAQPDVVGAQPAATEPATAPAGTAPTPDEGDVVADGIGLATSSTDDDQPELQADAARPGDEPGAAPTADALAEAPDADGRTDRSGHTTASAAGPSAGTTGVSAPAAPTATSATSATGQPTAPPLPDQLVEVLAPLRRAPDGTHRMAIQLRPDELGDVHIEFQVRGNEISLNLRADLASTNELLRDSLAQLRAELDAAGFRSGTLDVNDHGDPRAQSDRPDHDDAAARGRRSGDASADDAATTPDKPRSAVAGLDLRL